MSKTAMITIAGRPNVGKSTLMNRLVGEKIAIVSNKPQTTRNRISGIVTREDTQLVFIDTPGFHKPRTKLGDYMVNIVRESVADVDLILLLVEPIANIGPQEEALLAQIKSSGVPAILVINKIDQIHPDELFSIIDTYKEKYDFAEIVPISALEGNNVETLLNQIKAYLPEGPQYYPADQITDHPERFIISLLVIPLASHNAARLSQKFSCTNSSRFSFSN